MPFPKIIQQINSKLPLSGGTMTGIITRSGYLARSGNESNILAMISGTDVTHGAGIWLAGNSYTTGSVPAGAFRLQCYNPTTQVYTSLTGTNTGSLTWNGGEVITSKGGTMTGNLVFNGVANTGLRCANNSSRLSMVSSNIFDSACIHLWGSTNTGNYPGCVEIIPRIESQYTVWRFTPDGKFQKGTNTIHYITTTYSSGTTWYRVYSDGWKEMGGKCTPNNYDGMTVTLPKAFSNTSYEVLASSCDTVNKRSAQAWAKTASTIGVRTIAGTGQSQTPMWWYACGY